MTRRDGSRARGVRITIYVALGVVALTLLLLHPRAPAVPSGARPLPEFTHQAPADWLNSSPLTVASLRGKVLLIDFWTFECWNCYRSFPWLKELEAGLADEDFQVIGVHSPEFDRERDRDRVAAKVREFGLQHPVMIDNDFSYWNALDNRYWPAFYLVDRQGNIRYGFIGETHAGSRQAAAIEQRVRELLDEGK
jgi:thiol-disulfide isomerase/thioredoxin